MVEMVVIIAVVSLLVALLIPALITAKHKAHAISCNGNLKEIGISFRIWEGDHHDQYPMAVSVANSGTMEEINGGKVASSFQVMSNAVSVPEILICPDDARARAATNWNNLNGSNVSYYVGLDAIETDQTDTLSGDANLIQNGRATTSKILGLGTNITTWTPDRHFGTANVLFCDGSVQWLKQMVGNNPSGYVYAPTNRVVIP